jgi:hypothetical protein
MRQQEQRVQAKPAALVERPGKQQRLQFGNEQSGTECWHRRAARQRCRIRAWNFFVAIITYAMIVS